jgi:hypothetical protein
MGEMISLLNAVGQLVVMILVAYVLLRLAGLIQKLATKLEKD